MFTLIVTIPVEVVEKVNLVRRLLDKHGYWTRWGESAIFVCHHSNKSQEVLDEITPQLKELGLQGTLVSTDEIRWKDVKSAEKS